MEKITAQDVLEEKELKDIVDTGLATAEEIADIVNSFDELIGSINIKEGDDDVNNMDEEVLKAIPQMIGVIAPALTRVGKILVTNLRELQLKVLNEDPKALHLDNTMALGNALGTLFSADLARELAVHFYLTRQLPRQRPSGNVSQLLNIEKIDSKMLKAIGTQLIKPGFGSVGTTFHEILKVMFPVVKDAFRWTPEHAMEVAKSVWCEYMRTKHVLVEEKYALECAKKHVEMFI